jgi:hypothetical protein
MKNSVEILKEKMNKGKMVIAPFHLPDGYLVMKISGSIEV